MLVITGYPKFWGDVKQDDDACSKTRFTVPLDVFKFALRGNLLRADVRRQMNKLVVSVNDKIQSEILPINTNKIEFVDIDPLYEGHRLCEDGAKDPAGANSDSVWFTTFETTLQEDSFVPDPNSALEAQWSSLTQDLQPGDEFLPNELKINSNFHPKTAGHTMTAQAVHDRVVDWGNRHEHTPTPPPQQCVASDAPNLPTRIFVNANTILDPNQLLYELRASKSHISPVPFLRKTNDFLQLFAPTNVKFQPGSTPSPEPSFKGQVVVVKSRSVFRVARKHTLFVIAPFPAMNKHNSAGTIFKTVSLHTHPPTKHTSKLTHRPVINNCINNQPKYGWQAGIDPNPAFYQTGFRTLNAPDGKHSTIDPNHVLQQDLSGFKTICGKDDGWCQSNGCTGVNQMCTEGTYKGCGCAEDSKWNQLEPLEQNMQCKSSCCSTGTDHWYKQDWCNAHCGGVSTQFC